MEDTFKNWHDYELRWTPDKIEFVVDGKKERVVERKYTFNSTSNQYEFPQTPSRVQLSLWPGGLESNAKGTIDWAGGEIDWNHADIKNVGYFYAAVESVDVECYKTDSAPGTNSCKSYSYDDMNGTNDTVVDGDKDTIMASFKASGLDPDAGKKKSSKSSSSKTDDADKPKDTVASIPGGGNGAAGQDHSDEEGDSSSGSSGGGNSNAGDDGSAPADTGSCEVSSFHSDCNGGSKGNADSSTEGDGEGSASRSGASALAVIIAAVALFWL